jgi:hypothetical protein
VAGMAGPGDPQDGVVFAQTLTAFAGARVNAVQHGDQYNYIYRGAPPYRVESFAPAEPAPPAGLGRVPSRLLTARHTGWSPTFRTPSRPRWSPGGTRRRRG